MVNDHPNDSNDVTMLKSNGLENTAELNKLLKVNWLVKPHVDAMANSCSRGCNVDSVTTSRVDDLITSEVSDWLMLS